MIVPFLLCSAIIGRAQQPSAIADFSDGFKQLAALGMPPLDAKAQWSVVAEASNINYQLRELAKSVKGNAWLLPAAEDKPRAIALGGIEVIELKTAKKRPTEPDLTKDVEAIVAALKKLAAKMAAEDRDPFRYSSGGSNFGTCLLFAAQLHQTGHPALANQLALAVFAVFPSREAAVDAAVDLIADHSYQEVSRAFFTSCDWTAYHTALAALWKRFPRGWSSHDAVGIFLPQLEKQAAGAKAPVPALADIPIDPRALAIIAELTERPPVDPKHPGTKEKNSRGLSAAMRYRMQMGEGYDGDPSGPASLWLISEPPAGADPEAKASPLARLAALKMAAIPALAALAADPFLTRLPNSKYSDGGYSGYFSSSESSDDVSLRLYASLNRPATRGEIATQLLAATLPEAEDDRGQAADPEAIRDAALAFWKEHKTATREELAAVFLRDGSKRQSSQAATILASSKDPKAHQAFEAHVLAADPAIATFQDVQTYLRARKATARPFLDAYAKLVRSQGGASDNDNSNEFAWAVKQAGGAEKILKQLEALVGGQSPRALAVQIAKGKPADAQAAIKSLSSMLEDATPIKHLHALLEGANAATDASVRARFLTATFYIRGYNASDEEAPESDTESTEDPPAAERKVSEPEALVWRKLIADPRELPKEFGRDNGPGDEKPTVASVAAIAFEYTIGQGNVPAAYQASAIINKPFSAIIMERASARLNGKPVPPFPDASKVSKPRLTEIVAAAGSKPAAQVHPYLATLTPDERAAWQKWYRHPEEPAVPDSVKELEFIVISMAPTNFLNLPSVANAGNIGLGFKITPDSLTKHIADLIPEIDKHSRAFIILGPADFGPGLQVSGAVVALPAPKAKKAPNPDDPGDDERSPVSGANVFSEAIRIFESNEATSAIATLNLQSEQSRSQATWLIKDGKATLQPADAKDDDAKDPLAAALKTLLESKESQRFRIYLQFLTRADADKFAAAKTGNTGSPDDPDGDSSDSSDPSDPSENSSSSAKDPSPPTEEEE